MKIKLPPSTTTEFHQVLEQKLKCPVCDQAFISEKSLHGHMRKHSDRSWRGMNPPISPDQKNHQNQQVNNHPGGSTSFLPRWSNTGRRRRTTGKALIRVPASDAGEPSNKSNLPLKKRRLVVPDQQLGDPAGTNVCKIQIAPRREHACNICGRSFKSYQALGGHKAHHSVKLDHKLTTSAGGDHEIVHGCEYCDKVFSNGQALGGHKRHCRGPAPETNEVVRVAGNTVFSFDLNELPPEMENSTT